MSYSNIIIFAPNLPTRKVVVIMLSKKYIYYKRKTIYAIYYRSLHTIYYNLDFSGTTQKIMLF
nr:MAG TPA: hypothetical protein [Caudoviricetes sp.]